MLVHDAAPAKLRREGRAVSDGEETPAQEFERKIGVAPARLHALVADLSVARAGIYWSDLLTTCAVAYGALWLSAQGSPGPVRAGLCMALSACAVYRATLFTHELAHLPREALPGFRIAWHLLCGLPLLVPSFLYEIHGAHHDRRSYASREDGEYRAFAALPRLEALASLGIAVFAVPALVARFLLLAPLGWMIPRFRRWLFANASALVIDVGAPRPLPERFPLRWTLQEAGCFVWCAGLAFAYASEQLAGGILLGGYFALTGAVFLNAVRVLCAHRYRGQDAPMSFVEQVLDSNNFPRGLAWLWAPLGLRYHALHHLFPSLPYHALGEAYRRVMTAVPPRSAFRATDRSSLWAGLDDVVGRRTNGSKL